ncbi:MAG TPA: hypothetical protein P5133_08560 [Spirochaetia bacterium]|nr:hypothetical protein [Spirochaetia bacterium]HRZ64965.1 hypothetical protein [Spirochaetia bacterium]
MSTIQRVFAACAALSTFSLLGGPRLATLSAQGLAPRPAAELLGTEAFRLASAEGKALRASEGGKPVLLPAHPSAEALRAALAAEKPAVLVEAAFVLPRPAPEGEGGLAAELGAIYGLLGSFGSLEGIEYWSVSKGGWKVFYEESYRVDGPETKRRLADPPAPGPGALPPAEEVYVFQRDTTFGGNYYRYSFASSAGAVSLASNNLTRLSYGIIPMLAPGALATRLLVLQASDAIVFYAASGAAAPELFRSRLEKSFGNRAEALFRWFAARARAEGLVQ